MGACASAPNKHQQRRGRTPAQIQTIYQSRRKRSTVVPTMNMCQNMPLDCLLTICEYLSVADCHCVLRVQRDWYDYLLNYDNNWRVFYIHQFRNILKSERELLLAERCKGRKLREVEARLANLDKMDDRRRVRRLNRELLVGKVKRLYWKHYFDRTHKPLCSTIRSHLPHSPSSKEELKRVMKGSLEFIHTYLCGVVKSIDVSVQLLEKLSYTIDVDWLLMKRKSVTRMINHIIKAVIYIFVRIKQDIYIHYPYDWLSKQLKYHHIEILVKNSFQNMTKRLVLSPRFKRYMITTFLRSEIVYMNDPKIYVFCKKNRLFDKNNEEHYSAYEHVISPQVVVELMLDPSCGGIFSYDIISHSTVGKDIDPRNCVETLRLLTQHWRKQRTEPSKIDYSYYLTSVITDKPLSKDKLLVVRYVIGLGVEVNLTHLLLAMEGGGSDQQIVDILLENLSAHVNSLRDDILEIIPNAQPTQNMYEKLSVLRKYLERRNANWIATFDNRVKEMAIRSDQLY